MRLLSEFSKCSDRKIKPSKSREIADFRTIFFFHNIATITLNVTVPITFWAWVCMALCRNAILRPFFTMRTEQNSVFLNMNRKFGTYTLRVSRTGPTSLVVLLLIILQFFFLCQKLFFNSHYQHTKR